MKCWEKNQKNDDFKWSMNSKRIQINGWIKEQNVEYEWTNSTKKDSEKKNQREVLEMKSSISQIKKKKKFKASPEDWLKQKKDDQGFKTRLMNYHIQKVILRTRAGGLGL